MERFKTILLVAGVFFFLFSYAVMGYLPGMLTAHLKVRTLEDMTQNVMPEFEDLATRYPTTFASSYGKVDRASFAKALDRGHRIYVAEGCWHCHSQFVRPVSSEAQRWGPVATIAEAQNVLQMPVLYGTRRVGPDLSRENGRHTNDWHAAHFYEPKNVVPVSVMPGYPWFFDKVDGAKTPQPNADGLAIITYVQWLGLEYGETLATRASK